jgi:tetratricopeptide (TPR) repeat protein
MSGKWKRRIFESTAVLLFYTLVFLPASSGYLYSLNPAQETETEQESQQEIAAATEGQTESQEGSRELTLESVNKLMESLSVENCEKAIEGYKELLKQKPDDVEILSKLAIAHIRILDIKTSALIEEKSEYKPLLRELGKAANEYAEKAHALDPSHKEAIAASLLSYGYYSASFGIIKAIFKGAAGHYKDLARELIKADENYQGGLAYRSLGKLYHVAPWPVGSKKKALRWFKKALEVDSSYLYTHYYLGLIYFDKDEYDLAEKEFMYVLTNQPNPLEKHLIKAYKDSARQYIQKVAKEKQDD